MSTKLWKGRFALALAVLVVSLAGFLLTPSSLPETDLEIEELLMKERAIDAGSILRAVPKPAISTAEDDESIASAAAKPVALAEDRQRQIWDLEHYTFELEWKFGKRIKDALRHRDQQAMLACFRQDSSGGIPSVKSERNAVESWWHEHELGDRDGNVEVEKVSTVQLTRFLVDFMGDFSEIRKVGLRVLQIHKSPKQNDEYDLKLLITATGNDFRGPASLHSMHRLRVQFSDEKEITQGRIIRNWTVDSITVRGSSDTLFAEVTTQYGLDRISLSDNWMCEPGTQPDTYTSQVAVEDFDRDGYLDIAISSWQGEQYLLRSKEGHSFEDVTARMGLPSKRLFSTTTFSTWIDYDNDGYPDLLIGKHLYRNEKGKRFRRAMATGLKFDAATMGAVVADYDCDGWLDLYVLNHLGESNGKTIGFVGDNNISGVKNQLWRNLGNGTFQDVTDAAGVDGDSRHSFAAAWFFANEDRYPDLYLVNDFGRNCLFINRGDGSFDDVTEAAAVGDFANSMGVATGDLDNDGTAEIYVANMFSKMGRRIISNVDASDYPDGVFDGIEGSCSGSHLYQRSNSDTTYREISVEQGVNEIGWAYGPVFADFDADGLLDIYATSGFISVDRNKPDG